LSVLNTNTGPWANRIAVNFNKFVNWYNQAPDFTTFRDTSADYPGIPRCLALGYDWLYEVMTPLQRSNALFAIDSTCRYVLEGLTFWRSETTSGIKNDYGFAFGARRRLRALRMTMRLPTTTCRNM
jgi:hypothetical protein